MMASTRRAALGAILTAPLAPMPACAAQALASDKEKQFISLAVAALPEIQEQRRIWAMARDLYDEACRQFPCASDGQREASPVWQQYNEYWRQSSDIIERLFAAFEPFMSVQMKTERGILLKIYSMTCIYEDDEVCWTDLEAFAKGLAPCA